MLCLCSCSSWGWACQGPKHVEDSNVTYMLLLNCAVKLVEEIILNIYEFTYRKEDWRPAATLLTHIREPPMLQRIGGQGHGDGQPNNQTTNSEYNHATRNLRYHSPRLLRTPVAVVKQRRPLPQLTQTTKNLFEEKRKHESATPVSPLIRKTRRAGTPTFHRLTSAKRQSIPI